MSDAQFLILLALVCGVAGEVAEGNGSRRAWGWGLLEVGLAVAAVVVWLS